MGKILEIREGILHAVFEIDRHKPVYLLHFAAAPFCETDVLDFQKEKFKLVQLQAVGYDHAEHHGSKHTGTMPGGLLTYIDHVEFDNEFGKKLIFHQEAETLKVETHIQFFAGIPAARFWNIVENKGGEEYFLEYVSSAALVGCGKEGLLPWDEKMQLYLPANTWAGEVQWRDHSLWDWGLSRVEGTSEVRDPQSMQNFSLKRINIASTGSWGCSEYLPMGILENRECSLAFAWQIENHSTWQWEISDNLGQLYLQLSGPTGSEHQWYKNLKPGERFETVKAAVSVGENVQDAMASMTLYRRKIRRENEDNQQLPVIFNDYMNCLYGDPTTEKLLPLIDAAADVGCEYFCIDAGWYGDGIWWDEVGEWLPSQKRFPKGILEPIQYIRQKGMVPGLWLELEVMGVHCRLADQLPDSCFFQQKGRRIIDHGRYQLDFRNEEVRRYASAVIKRLVEEYGVGYIKMDYNINAGVGTDYQSDSMGDGLLEHSRVYLNWLHEVLGKYPGLVIENCSSGGMRMAYSLLEILSIQSVSDQIDYKKMACIAAASPTAVTPEQAAIWSYPVGKEDEEEAIFNMVNALLFRVHQSGHLTGLSSECYERVKEGIHLYKEIRGQIREGIPFWPLGFPVFGDEWISYGMQLKDRQEFYLAVWHIGEGKDAVSLPLKKIKGEKVQAECIYPSNKEVSFRWDSEEGIFEVVLPKYPTARLFHLRW